MYAHMPGLNNYKDHINSFYSYTNNFSFKGITKERIEKIKDFAKEIHKQIYENVNIKDYWKIEKYLMTMNFIKTKKTVSQNYNNAEKLLIFMFAVDPELEANLIHEECNTKDEQKIKMEQIIGVDDPNLWKIERFYIKYFLGPDEKSKINEEVEKRVFK